jgi:tRNA(fMet)-specific endonuclease VapC
MTLYIFDTDHASLAEQGHPQITKRVLKANPNSLAITIITAEEQLRGWFSQIRHAQAKPDTKLVWAYTGFRRTLAAISRIQVLDFDQTALTIFQQFQKQKVRIGSQDLRIAAITLAAEGILLTRNRRDFAQVPGLLIEDWTMP